MTVSELIPKKSHRGKSAAYETTPINWAPTIPGVLMILIPGEIIALILFPAWRAAFAPWLLLGISIPFAAWLFFYWKIYLSVFVTRSLDKEQITDPRWKPFTFSGWGNEKMKAQIIESELESKDLALYLHGYRSSLGRGESRCLHLHDIGFNVVSLDQRGFGEQQGRVDWTILKVLADIEGLLEEVPKQLGFIPEKFWIYGHSMGGFLTIRLSSHPSSWWENSLKGIILESPATSFPKIIEKHLPGRMGLAMPWIRHILRREYERIHPDLNVRYANAELPFWGIPNLPTLVVQAKDDEVLGSEHFSLVKQYLSDNSDIHLADIPHTSTVDKPERQNIVENWLNEQVNG